LLAPTRPAQVLQAVVRWVVINVVDFVLVVSLGEGEGDRHEYVDLVVFAVAKDANVAAFGGFGGGDDAIGGFEATEGGDPRGFVRLPHLALENGHLAGNTIPKLVTARLLAPPTATRTDVPWLQP